MGLRPQKTVPGSVASLPIYPLKSYKHCSLWSPESESVEASPAAASKIGGPEKGMSSLWERVKLEWGRGGAKSASISLHYRGQPCRLLEACRSETLPFRPKLSAGQRSLSPRKTQVVFQSAVCTVPWGWWSGKNCLSNCYSPMGFRDARPPHPPNLVPSNQGVSAGDSWKNQDTRCRTSVAHADKSFPLEILVLWSSAEAWRPSPSGKKRGKMVPTSLSKAEEEQSTHQPPPQRGS